MTAHTATKHGSFNRIYQVATICSTSKIYSSFDPRDSATKWHLSQFSHICRAHTFTQPPKSYASQCFSLLRQPFTALWILSGTNQVSQYQKKHSPTHTYRSHRSSLICFLHLLWSTASSLFNLRAWQSFSTISLHVHFDGQETPKTALCRGGPGLSNTCLLGPQPKPAQNPFSYLLRALS